MENKTPEKSFRAGAVSASIWLNKGKAKDGTPVEFRTVSIQRSYKDQKDQWQHTTNMRASDLPKATLVLNKAYEFISLNHEAADPAASY